MRYNGNICTIMNKLVRGTIYKETWQKVNNKFSVQLGILIKLISSSIVVCHLRFGRRKKHSELPLCTDFLLYFHQWLVKLGKVLKFTDTMYVHCLHQQWLSYCKRLQFFQFAHWNVVMMLRWKEYSSICAIYQENHASNSDVIVVEWCWTIQL